jgi:hypothetical protein
MIKQYKVAAGTTGRMVRPGAGSPEPWTLKNEALFESDELLAEPILGTWECFAFIRKGWTLEVPSSSVELVKTSSPRVKKEALPVPPPPPPAIPSAPAMTEELRKSIHSALKGLAGVCNYASTWDAQGFSKLDADFGHKLADQEWLLTEKQAICGARLVVKYRKQVADEKLIEACRPFLKPRPAKQTKLPLQAVAE